MMKYNCNNNRHAVGFLYNQRTRNFYALTQKFYGMQYLVALDKLITKAFSFQHLSKEPLQVKAFGIILDEASNTATQLKTGMLDAAFQSKCKKEMAMFVQNCQAVCTGLSNKIFSGRNVLSQLDYDTSSRTLMLEKHAMIQASIYELLIFLETYYSRYFDGNQVVPLQTNLKRREDLKLRLTELNNRLHTLFPAEPVNGLLAPVVKFLSNEGEPATYVTLEFFNRYLTGLEETSRHADPDSISLAVVCKCVELDYCPAVFVEYYLTTIRAQAEKCETSAGAKQVWFKQAVILSLSPTCTGETAFVKTRLLNLVHTELNSFDADTEHIILKPQLEGAPEKSIRTALSVAQLGLFIRLLVDTGIIKSKNHSFLLRVLAATFQTDKAAAISPESLRVKFYATDRATVNIIKEYLFLLLNQLKKH